MQSFDALKTLNRYITSEGKLNILGGQKEGFDALKTINRYITPEGKINILSGQKEGFDPDLLPEQLYNIQVTELKLGDVQEMKTFVRNLDTPIKDMTANLLTNRIQILTAVKSWLLKMENTLKDELKQQEQRGITTINGKLVFSNLNSIFLFIYRLINLVISHSEELKRQLASGGSIEFFTITPIVMNIPEEGKTNLNKFISKYGLTFDDVVEFINNAEFPAKELNSKGKILRLRVLSLFRQILALAMGNDFFVRIYLKQNSNVDENVQPEVINTTVQLVQLIHNVVSYIIDLHLKELYDNMTSTEIKIGNYFEKFIRYYPTENEVVNKELSRSRITLTDLQSQIDSIKIDADKRITDAEKRINDAKVDAEKRVNDAKVDGDKRVNDAKVDGDKRVTDAKNSVNKIIEDANSENNKKINDNKTIQMGLIGGNVLMLLLCCIMTVMYFRK